MEGSNQFLGTERIGKLMQKYAIPCIISLLVGALYNIVDQIFIANASYLGSYGNAANTVVFPLTVVALAIAVMIGDGCCAFVSISLGQDEVRKAKQSVGNAVVVCLVSSIVLTAIYLIFADIILAMFGGTVNAETYRHSQEYFFYITLGVPFYMFGQAMNPIIRADGSPPVCHDLHPCRGSAQCHFGSDLYFWVSVGHDGSSRCHCHWSGGHGNSRRVVLAAHEDH